MLFNSELSSIIQNNDADGLRNFLTFNKIKQKELKCALRYMIENDNVENTECYDIMVHHVNNLSIFFSSSESLSVKAVIYAFEKHIISPTGYYWSRKNLTYQVASILDNPKWSMIIIKSNKTKTKSRTMKLFNTLVSDYSLLPESCDDEVFEMFGRFAKKCGIKFNVQKIAAKLHESEDVIKEVLVKMKI